MFCVLRSQYGSEVHVMGMASEVKVEGAAEDAVNECYYNVWPGAKPGHESC